LDPIIYFFAEYFPWWALPSALIFAEVANHFRRTGKRLGFFFFSGVSLVLAALTILYFVKNGFVNLRPAMQNLEKTYVK
jgi:hypothetical protein